MSAVVCDVGYDTRMIKKRQNMFTVQLLVAVNEKKTSQDIDRPKNIKILKLAIILFVTYVIPYR